MKEPTLKSIDNIDINNVKYNTLSVDAKYNLHGNIPYNLTYFTQVPKDIENVNNNHILMVHATGFHKELWFPLIIELRKIGVTCPVTAFDVRCHGDSDVVFSKSWFEMSVDVINIMQHIEIQSNCTYNWIGVGHSMGGALLAYAEIIKSNIFKSLVLYEPILLNLPKAGNYVESPLISISRKRRSTFKSKLEAYENFKSKSPFNTWLEQSLLLYIHHGLKVVLEDGKSIVKLKCDPQNESNTFAATLCKEFDKLSQVNIPIILITGQYTESLVYYFESTLKGLLLLLPNCKHIILKDATHFGIMEKPTQIAELIYKVLNPTLSKL